MNTIQRIALKMAGINPNQINRALFKYVTRYAPIYIDDDPQSYIDDGYSINSDVYAIIGHITSAMSSVPPIVYEVKNQKQAGQYRRLKHASRYQASAEVINKGLELKEEAFEEVPESDLAKLIERPNPLQAFPEFVENVIGFKLITGNSYVHGVELTDKRFGEMWVLPSQYTRLKADPSFETLITAYILEIYGQFSHEIPPETVMHLKYWNPDYSTSGSHLYGMSPLKAARTVLTASNDGKTAMSRSFRNMGAEGMIFPDDPDVDSLTPVQQSQIEEFFKQKGGPENYKSKLVTSAKMGWQPFGMSPVDLEIIEASKSTQRDLCNIFKFPSVLLNDPDSKTFANHKEARKQLWLDVCIPELERLYSELNRWLLPRFPDKNYFIDYDVSGVEALQENMSEKSTWLHNAWTLTPNEKRQELGYEAVKNPLFDEPYIPMGIHPLSESGLPELTDDDEKTLNEIYR